MQISPTERRCLSALCGGRAAIDAQRQIRRRGSFSLLRPANPKRRRATLAAALQIGSALLFLAGGVCSAQKPELVVQTGHSGWVYSVAFSPDGKLLASGSSDQTIKLWDVATGTELRSLRGHT